MINYPTKNRTIQKWAGLKVQTLFSLTCKFIQEIEQTVLFIMEYFPIPENLAYTQLFCSFDINIVIDT